jgi:hypothetical protein
LRKSKLSTDLRGLLREGDDMLEARAERRLRVSEAWERVSARLYIIF